MGNRYLASFERTLDSRHSAQRLRPANSAIGIATGATKRCRNIGFGQQRRTIGRERFQPTNKHRLARIEP